MTRVCAVLAILADALLLTISWRVLGPSGRDGVSFRGKGLVYVRLRDGTTGSLLMVLNAPNLTFITYASEEWYQQLLRTFLPSVLVSRFLLDLQEVHQRKVVVLASGSRSPLDSSGSGSSPGDDYPRRAPPALGALGATIDPTEWDDLPDDELEHVDEDANAAFLAPRRVHPADGGFTQGSPPKIRDEYEYEYEYKAASSDSRLVV
ncbi:hypothetical protein V8D89_008770 [Ganoderma adspersum]